MTTYVFNDPYQPDRPNKPHKPDTPEPLPEFRQPAPFVQFQVVAETARLEAAIFALDQEGKLWFRLLSPQAGEGWKREELCGQPKKVQS